MKRNIFLLSLLFIALSCGRQPKEEVKNVIYLIGDGMGFGAVSSLLLTDDSTTAFEMEPVIGLSESCSANNHVTDSPAGGTALACGERTLNGYVGLDVNGRPMTSILKKAQQMGKSTGIVVNTVLTEATPADFYAGVFSRSESYKIAEQFVESGVDVAIGSGISVFKNRPDSLDLIKRLEEKGYNVYEDKESTFASESDKFVAILPMSDVHRRNVPDSLAQEKYEAKFYLEKAVKKALEVLSAKGENGYFLMIESAIIDGYGHNNDSDGMIEEMADFNRLVVMLADWVKSNPNTLLVVTADHETGGTSVAYKEHKVGEKVPLTLSFSTKGHSGTVVPIFAYGTGADSFGRVMKNVEIPRTIESLMKGE